MRRFVYALRIVLVISLLVSILPAGTATASGNSVNQPVVAPFTDFAEVLSSPDPEEYLPPVAQLPDLLTRSSTYSSESFLLGQAAFAPDLLGKSQSRSNPLDPASGSLALLQQVSDVNQYLVDAFAFDSDASTASTVSTQNEQGASTPANSQFSASRQSVQLSQEPLAIASSVLSAASTTLAMAPESQPIIEVNPQPVAAPAYVLPDDKVIRSEDGRIQVVVPGAATEGLQDVAIATVPAPIKGLSAQVALPQDSLYAFTLTSDRDAKTAATQWLRQPASLTLTYDDKGLSPNQEGALRLYAFNADLSQWYSLPSQVNPATNTVYAQSLALTTYALAPAILGATQDPCAIGVELVADNAYPFQAASRDGDGDIIPRGTFFNSGYGDNFPNWVGTEVYVSSTDTGDIMKTNPMVTTATQTKDKVTLRFPLGENIRTGGTTVSPIQDVTAYFPPNPITTLPDGTSYEQRVFTRTVNITLEHRGNTSDWGVKEGYYLIRKDIAPPIITQFYSYHDGEGGVNLYVTAYDNCAVKQIGANALNSTGGGMSTMFEYLGASTDGLGLYRADVWLPTTGTNVYTVLVEDMADYDGPNTVTATYSEQASNSAGYGDYELCGKSSSCANVACGCAASSGMAGDPVNTATGNFTMSRTDAVIAGIGDTDIVVDRSYNSLASGQYYSFIGAPRKQVPPFGIGWTSPFGFNVEVVERLPLVGPGVKVNYPDGHSVRYAGIAGVLTPLTPGEANILEGTGTSFTLTDKATLGKYRFVLAVDPTKPVNIASLVEKTDANGNTITYTPGPFGPTSIINSAGRTISLTYNGDGLITQISGPEGLSLSYAYSNLLLTSMTDERGQTTTYSYDGEYRLVQEATPKGHPPFGYDLCCGWTRPSPRSWVPVSPMPLLMTMAHLSVPSPMLWAVQKSSNMMPIIDC